MQKLYEIEDNFNNQQIKNAMISKTKYKRIYLKKKLKENQIYKLCTITSEYGDK